MTPNPVTPTHGHGELIRAQRLYLGLSQRELARTIPMDRRTYQRIEGGVEPCPTGFLDTMALLVDRFDTEVEQTIDQADKMVKAIGQASVHFNVDTDDESDAVWSRAVIGRAAVESGLIVPESQPIAEVTTV